MQIEERELDDERVTCRAILMKSWWKDLDAVNCQPKAGKFECATSSISYIMWIVVDSKLTGHQASGCK